MDQSRDGNVVVLEVPATPPFISSVRLQVASVGNMLDLPIDYIDDLRLAVEELCLWVLARERGSGRLRIELGWDDESVTAQCAFVGGSRSSPEAAETDEVADPISVEIIAAIADEHGFNPATPASAWLRKVRSS